MRKEKKKGKALARLLFSVSLCMTLLCGCALEEAGGRESAPPESPGPSAASDASEAVASDSSEAAASGSSEGTASDSGGSLDGTYADSSIAVNPENYQLTEKGREFLVSMCYYLPDFSGPGDMDEEFWQNVIFYSYTGLWGEDVETVQVEREDLGFEETQIKVSLEEVEAYVKLALGVELPEFRPAFEDMREGQTACYFRDGYFYIGVSDFPQIGYTFRSCSAAEDGSILAEYRISYLWDEEGEDVGTVTFTLEPADNENGFVILAKKDVKHDGGTTVGN